MELRAELAEAEGPPEPPVAEAREDRAIRVVIAHDEEDVMRAGAVSFLIKGAQNQEILRTIRQAAGF